MRIGSRLPDGKGGDGVPEQLQSPREAILIRPHADPVVTFLAPIQTGLLQMLLGRHGGMYGWPLLGI